MSHPGPRVVLALVAAATAVPAGAEGLRGYGRTVAGMSIAYHSPYPDITSALIVRASDGTSSAEWETEAVPADWGTRPATFLWLAGLATGKGAHRFELSVDGRTPLVFRTSADSSRREWREAGPDGVALSFQTVMVDQFDELFGFMRLEVPAALLRPGRPLSLKVAGEKGGSNDWFMTFQDDLRREIWARSEQALVREGGALFQIVRVAISHLGPPAKAAVSCTGAKRAQLDLKLGYNALEFLVPAVDKDTPVALEVALDDGSVRRGELVVKPVVPREIWLLPHSHVDIGYSDPQPVVERNHWRYYGEAIALAARTAGYPEGSRFKWNTEQAWAVETYFRQAGDEEKKAFLDAMRSGAIGLQATLAGVLTGLCHPEELIRLTAFARRLGREAGTAVDSVMVTDIPGQSWSFVPALALAGIKYVSSGPNYMPSLFDGGDRVGWALKTWGDRPFYWLSPSGREKVLFWMAGRGYSWFHGLNMGSLKKAPPYRIVEYMNELAEKGYPYSMVQVRYTIGGDNGPPDPDLADTVRSWNERYVSPRIVIATASEMFAELERRHGPSLPVVRGDFTGYWEDGAASTARETAMSRTSANRLVQAEALWSILGRDGFQAAKDAEAWRQVILFSEHTWGAHDSVSNPDGEGPRAQWEYKKAFAERADQMSKELLAAASGGAGGKIAKYGRQAVDVVNTCSWPRTDLVLLPWEVWESGERVEDETGAAVPSQRLSTGELAFVARDVPGLGARRYTVGAGDADKTEVSSRTLKESWFVSHRYMEDRRPKDPEDSANGAIVSLVWTNAGTDRELVDKSKWPGLAHYLYVPGVDSRKAETPSEGGVGRLVRGPVLSSVVLNTDSPGAKTLHREYRQVLGLDRLEIQVTIDKEKVRDKESVHLAFPFAVPGGAVRVDVGWGFVRPEADQLEGACRDFFCARDSVDVSNGEFGVTWTSLDAPLVEIGALTDETPRESERRIWLRRIEPSTTLFSYAMNNYWHTNYKADQEGQVTLRYAVSPHLGSDPAVAKKLALEATTPLVAVPAAYPAAAAPRFPLAIDSPSFVAMSLRPSDDGRAFLLRLLNASDRPETLRLSGPACDAGRVFLSDVDGVRGARPAAPLEVPAFGIVTLRIEKAK
jgi:alpha-mannosidase